MHTGATTAISQFCGVNVILSLWREKRQRLETVDDVFAGAWPDESLQQLLQDEPGAHDGLVQGVAQGAHLRRGRWPVAAMRAELARLGGVIEGAR